MVLPLVWLLFLWVGSFSPVLFPRSFAGLVPVVEVMIWLLLASLVWSRGEPVTACFLCLSLILNFE